MGKYFFAILAIPTLPWTSKGTSFPRFTSGVVTHNSMWVHKSPCDSSGFAELARPLASRRFRGSRRSPGSSCRCPDSSRLTHFHLGYGRGATTSLTLGKPSKGLGSDFLSSPGPAREPPRASQRPITSVTNPPRAPWVISLPTRY